MPPYSARNSVIRGRFEFQEGLVIADRKYSINSREREVDRGGKTGGVVRGTSYTRAWKREGKERERQHHFVKTFPRLRQFVRLVQILLNEKNEAENMKNERKF
jgi:hypothetical protein